MIIRNILIVTIVLVCVTDNLFSQVLNSGKSKRSISLQSTKTFPFTITDNTPTIVMNGDKATIDASVKQDTIKVTFCKDSINVLILIQSSNKITGDIYMRLANDSLLTLFDMKNYAYSKSLYANLYYLSSGEISCLKRSHINYLSIAFYGKDGQFIARPVTSNLINMETEIQALFK